MLWVNAPQIIHLRHPLTPFAVSALLVGHTTALQLGNLHEANDLA